MSDPEPRPRDPLDVTRDPDEPDLGEPIAARSSPRRRAPLGAPGDEAADPAPTAGPDTGESDAGTVEYSPTDPSRGAGAADGARRALPAIPGYEILGELGRGGMGVVYKARHRRLHRICALKMVLAGPHAAPEALVRFLAEAEAVAKLRHPRIVAIHHIGEHDGLPFIELEYLAGGSLDEQLDGTPLPPRRAAERIATLADAVQAAHEAGVVHRDLKPANVLLDEDGTPKVADFGVAKALGPGTGLTATDSILGSPSYMAPEQAGGRSREVGPAADVYALGAILYETLTGRPPFRAATVLETLEQVKNTEPVPPSRLVPGLPRDAETIALKCLQKAPEKRYGTAAALAEDLRRFLDGQPILARPVPSWERVIKWGRRRPAIAALVVVVPLLIVALLGLGAWSYIEINRSLAIAKDRAEALRRQSAVTRVQLALREYEAANIAVAEAHLDACPEVLRFLEWHLVKRLCHRERRTFHDHKWHAWDVAFSPGGDRVASVAGGWAFTNAEPGRGELLVRDAETGRVVFERRGLRHGLFTAAFDPTSKGRYLATGGGLSFSEGGGIESFVVEATLDVWDTETGERRTLDAADGQNVIGVAYSPDGAVLAAAYGIDPGASHRGYVRVWDVATGKSKGEPFTGMPGGVSAVAFSPDGRWLALAAGFDEERRYRIEIWDWQERKLARSLFGADSYVTNLAFSPDGRSIASSELGSRLIRLWDVTTGEHRVFMGHESFVQDLAFSPDGKDLASCAEDNLVKLWDVATAREIESLRGHSSFVLGVAFGPGRRLASCDVTGSVKVWDAEPGRPVRLETDGWSNRLAFHRDGRRLATASYYFSQGFAPQLWDLDTGRLLREKSFRGHEGLVDSVALSHDGALLVSGSRDPTASMNPSDRTARVWDVETGRQLVVLDHRRWGGVRDVAFHPEDNARLATGCPDGTVLLWTIDPTGKVPPASTVIGRLGVPIEALAFRPPLGRELAAGAADGSVHVWRVETKEEVLAIPDLGERVLDVAFSADGALLATANDAGYKKPGSATVWDMESGRRRFTLPLAESVSGVAFNRDGTRLATACFDKTVKLWDVATGQDVLTLRGHNAGVLGVAFSPDGRRLASASIDRTVLVWDAAPGGPARDGR